MHNTKHISKHELPNEILTSKFNGKQLKTYDFTTFVCVLFNEESFNSFLNIWKTRKQLAEEEHQSAELVKKAERILEFLYNNKTSKISHWMNSKLNISFLYSKKAKEVLFL